MAKQKETEEITKVKEGFENTYFKETVDCPLFGKTLKVYHLKNYVRSERTTDWELIYYFQGSKVSFSKRDINKRDFNPDRCGDGFGKEDLEQMSIITKEDYESYIQKYNQISKQLEGLIT